MKIGIIGSGNMGRTLGLTWVEKGHDVFFGSRNERDIGFIKKVYKKEIRYGRLQDAVLFGDVLLYSLRDTLPSSLLDPQQWAGKIIIDCNNGSIPGDFNYPPVRIAYTEKYQQDVPAAKVVKAFNSMAQEVYSHEFDTIKSSGAFNLLAGDDDAAKEVVSALTREIGLRPIDAGYAYNARLLESYGDLVRLLMIKNKLGPFLVFSAQVLPAADTSRMGERQDTKYL